jgi:uncharacterized membrane protein HdeD (DUF308 family)
MTPPTYAASGVDRAPSGPWAWPLLLGLGLIFLITGCLATGNAILAAEARPYAYGGLMMLAGCAALVHAIAAGKSTHARLWLLATGLYLIAGTTAFANPAFDRRVLTLLLAGLLAASGLARGAAAIMWRGYGFGWPLMSGLASLVFAAMLANPWPQPVLRLLGLVLAIDMLVQAMMLILLATSVRKVAGSRTGDARLLIGSEPV